MFLNIFKVAIQKQNVSCKWNNAGKHIVIGIMVIYIFLAYEVVVLEFA